MDVHVHILGVVRETVEIGNLHEEGEKPSERGGRGEMVVVFREGYFIVLEKLTDGEFHVSFLSLPVPKPSE